jgi:hypothetical protein
MKTMEILARTRTAPTVDDFFAGHPASHGLYEAVLDAVRLCGPAEVRVSNSQIAFRNDHGFAWAWMPERYLRGERPPLVLSIALPREVASPRWKQVFHPARGWFMHHLELYRPTDVDDEVAAWIREAWNAARKAQEG